MRPRPSCDFGRHTCEAIAWFFALFSPRTHRPPALPRGASQGSLWTLAAALLSLSARCAPGVLVDPGHCFSLSSRAVRPRGPCGPWPLLFFFFPCGAPQGSLWTLAAALLLPPVRRAPGVLVDPGRCFSVSHSLYPVLYSPLFPVRFHFSARFSSWSRRNFPAARVATGTAAI